jgi:pSer/pThr/pTyr-binding forkhead associated (FHA) protein
MLRQEHRPAASEEALTVALPGAGQEVTSYDIVLKPLSHPELGDISIDENLFPIGRTEAPFESYSSDIVADLSRRHARIFSEYGAVYIADLGSKNGTSVNGIDIRQKTARLRNGDEICFAGTLSYRVHLGARTETPGRGARLHSLTLTPERSDLGMQPIVITQFPFLISKADEAFARYKDEYPHQVNYISRRHAHIFIKGGSPFVEDLGSTNGTFVDGKRLDEHAVPLKEGDLLAFGGHHFVYKVSLQMLDGELDPTVTKLSPTARRPAAAATAAPSVDVDKTTFVAAADSFLDIFCVDRAQQQEDELNGEEQKQADEAAKDADKGKPRGRIAIFVSQLMDAFLGSDRAGVRRALRWGSAAVALVVVLALALHFRTTPDEDLKNRLAGAEYAQAATAADQYLARDPDNAELKALGTEALLKAYVPQWLGHLRARDYGRANAVLAGMKQLGRHNADVQPMLNELEWMGNLERFVMGRGGPEAPIRIYADEERIKAILKRWDEDTQGHQRTFAAIGSIVPQFRDPYAEALSHLRKLQSDDAVYLAAIERLKAAISAELERDNPGSLDAMLNEYAEKYPRIGGLDNIRQDVRRYADAENAARERKLGTLVGYLTGAKFATPPFQARFRAIATGERFPPADVVRQYQGVANAWKAGNTKQAFDGLQQMASGPWGDAAAKELERKKAIVEQSAQLQKARGSKGYEERLLAYYGTLDPDEDAYFVRAAAPDIAQYKDRALARAQELLTRAQARWRQYRENGAIEGAQRLETAISNRFRTQARLLFDAQDDAQQGMRVYQQLKLERPAAWGKLQDEINAEADAQRKSLQDLRNVLTPGLLKAKMALLGGRNDDNERPSTTTAD